MPSRFDSYATHHHTRRLRHTDYTRSGWYFVTACTHDRLSFFGEVRGGVMGLSALGCLAHDCWRDLPAHTPGLSLGAFVVMPNYVHGLIRLRAPAERIAGGWPRPGSLGVVVGGYKATVTRAARRQDAAFAWQKRFHDHIVRDAQDFERIRAYIEANPAAWHRDRFHPQVKCLR